MGKKMQDIPCCIGVEAKHRKSALKNPTLFESAEFICNYLEKHHKDREQVDILNLCAVVFGFHLARES